MTPDPLAQLRDIHLPAPVSWWPPAPGWWIATLLVLALLGWGGYLLFRWYRKNRHRRSALQELAGLRQNPDPRIVLHGVAVLLRRVAIQSFGRQEVAGLTGQKWLAFLDRTYRGNQFTRGSGIALGENLYRAQGDTEIEPLLQLAEKWIRGHKK